MCMCTTRLSGLHNPTVSRFRLVCAKVPCQLGRERSRFSPVAVAYGLVFAGHHGPWLPVIQSRVVHGGPGFCCPALCGHESLLQARVGTSRSLQGQISHVALVLSTTTLSEIPQARGCNPQSPGTLVSLLVDMPPWDSLEDSGSTAGVF